MRAVLAGLMAMGALAFVPAPPALAKPAHNGACVSFAGATGGQKYAGVKCYLDSAPGNYVIRFSVKERDDPEQYRKLLKLTKRPVRCTLSNKGTTVFNGMENTSYKISNC